MLYESEALRLLERVSADPHLPKRILEKSLASALLSGASRPWISYFFFTELSSPPLQVGVNTIVIESVASLFSSDSVH